MGLSRRKFSREVKMAAIQQLDAGSSVAEVARAFEVNPNLLHRSDRNTSDDPRWSMICCYNARKNDPYKESHHPRYIPLIKVDDSKIREVGIRRFADDPGNVAWLDPHEDRSGRSLVREEKA